MCVMACSLQSQWNSTMVKHSGVASYGTLGHVPPRLANNFNFSSLWSKSIQVLCSLRDQLVQMSTTHSYFDQYCISHKTISHRAAAAPGPEVHRECPMTHFPALPLLATNPSDATALVCVMLSRAPAERW